MTEKIAVIPLYSALFSYQSPCERLRCRNFNQEKLMLISDFWKKLLLAAVEDATRTIFVCEKMRRYEDEVLLLLESKV